MALGATIDAWLAAAPACGLPVVNFVPSSLRPQCTVAAQRNKPPGAPPSFDYTCPAMLIARGFIYFKNVPGDCGSPSGLDLGNASLAAGAGSVAEAGLSTAANIAGAASGIASFASEALPGIGIAVQAITSIFQHHAQAVYTEQQTLCRIAGVVNQVIPYYDAQVRSGQVSPSTAYQGIQTFMAQVNAGLSTIEKQCNAACVYAGIFAAHADFAQSYYPAIAPVQFGAHAPGGAPAVYGTVPGGVIQVGSAVSSALSQSLAAIPSSAKGILLALGVAVAASLIVAVTVKS